MVHVMSGLCSLAPRCTSGEKTHRCWLSGDLGAGDVGSFATSLDQDLSGRRDGEEHLT